ncbi:hypothetical protein [Faecalibacterium hattorii]|uniref:hypothetical protein n=1 Tax=Faecalibacterium hattorii TaxID=2935520 RepID=UPI003AAE7EAF
MVVSPEHAMVKEWLEKGIIKNADAVKAYQAEAARKSDFERSELNKEIDRRRSWKASWASNPVNDKEIPIFISDYVLATYGTGAIMAVPAHDTRDWEFAEEVRPAHHRSRQGHYAFEPRRGCLHRRCHRHAGQLRLPRRPVRRPTPRKR